MPEISTKYIYYFAIAILIIGLGIYSYLGLFNRYYADDWCYNIDFDKRGIVGTLEGYSFIRTYASNRVSLTLFSGILYYFGVFGVQIMTFVTIGVWLVTLYWAFSNLNKLLKLGITRSPAIISSAIVVFSSLLLAPHLYQNFYWRSGLLPYTAPVIFGTLVVALVTHPDADQKRRIYLNYSLGPLAFLTSTFSEAGGTFFVAVATILVLVALVYSKKGNIWAARSLYSTGFVLLGSVVALIVLINSPANAPRQAISYGAPASITSLPWLISLYSYYFFRIITTTHALVFAFILLSSTAIAYLSNTIAETKLSLKKAGRLIAVIGVVSFLLIGASLAPSIYVEQGLPAARAQIIPIAILILATVSIGWIVGLYLKDSFKKRWLTVFAQIALIFCIFYTSQAVMMAWDKTEVFAGRAVIWDERDEYIKSQKAAGELSIAVEGVDGFHVGGMLDFKSKPGFWVNRCAARVYRVQEIYTK